MTIRPLSREEVRSIDRRAAAELGLSTLVLMENAGRGAAECLRAKHPLPGKVVILCGPGNNGGDGGVVARHLDAWGYEVRIVWFADPERLAPDAAAQFAILAKSGIAQECWVEDPLDPSKLELLVNGADWLVDGLLGTGLARPLTGPLLAVIDAANRSARPILALDLPSGLDADTGRPLGGAIRATLTVTFVAPKIGFGTPEASAFVGEIKVVEIGVPRCLLLRLQPRLLEALLAGRLGSGQYCPSISSLRKV